MGSHRILTSVSFLMVFAFARCSKGSNGVQTVGLRDTNGGGRPKAALAFCIFVFKPRGSFRSFPVITASLQLCMAAVVCERRAAEGRLRLWRRPKADSVKLDVNVPSVRKNICKHLSNIHAVGSLVNFIIFLYVSPGAISISEIRKPDIIPQWYTSCDKMNQKKSYIYIYIYTYQ